MMEQTQRGDGPKYSRHAIASMVLTLVGVVFYAIHIWENYIQYYITGEPLSDRSAGISLSTLLSWLLLIFGSVYGLIVLTIALLQKRGLKNFTPALTGSLGLPFFIVATFWMEASLLTDLIKPNRHNASAKYAGLEAWYAFKLHKEEFDTYPPDMRSLLEYDKSLTEYPDVTFQFRTREH
ncbi:MAG: hypothetical protein M5R36_04110 [Deltaproteobacteria bacterium]|nr:hypothetical protein [Deltaproteobacteria bacterium]